MNAWPTNSAKLSAVRRGYFENAVDAISRNETDLRWRTVIGSPGSSSSSWPVSERTSSSISPTISSASSSRPWMNSQRSDSGTCRRTSRIPSPSTAPIAKASRHAMSGAKMLVSSSTSAPIAPPAAPSR
jgi:exo-beta-1,3-glucanase (GH17 family)